jgi:hypothetical protein
MSVVSLSDSSSIDASSMPLQALRFTLACTNYINIHIKETLITLQITHSGATSFDQESGLQARAAYRLEI